MREIAAHGVVWVAEGRYGETRRLEFNLFRRAMAEPLRRSIGHVFKRAISSRDFQSASLM